MNSMTIRDTSFVGSYRNEVLADLGRMHWRALPHLDELEAGMKEPEGW